MFRFCFIVIFLSVVMPVFSEALPESARASQAMAVTGPLLQQALNKQGLTLGSPIFIRIFKHLSELEMWVEDTEGAFQLFKTYRICKYSGKLGPKTRKGDWQAPEGFYFVKPSQLNPWSKFHLSVNLGYPNAYDRYYGRTGSALMVHGACVSIGCYAMTDGGIEEIYTLAYQALKQGQPYFRVHVFPFRLQEGELQGYEAHRWFTFWKNLQEGYLWFEKHKRPPDVNHQHGRYIFSETSE